VERIASAADRERLVGLGAVAAQADPAGVLLRVTPTTAPKCVRCWHRREDVGSSAEHPELCGRCIGNLEGPGEARHYA
jgi:isoleucyl-tRNA synthetase